MFVAPRAGKSRRKLRTDFPSMTVTELMEYAAMLVEEAMVSVAQPEGTVAGNFDILVEVGQPGASVGIVIDDNHVRIRNRGSQNAKLQRKSNVLLACFQQRGTLIDSRRGISRNPEIDPEGLRILLLDCIVRFRQRRAVRLSYRDEGIGVVLVVGFGEMKPFPE